MKSSMLKVRNLVVFFLSVGIFLGTQVSAATYYVSPSGGASWAECQVEDSPCSPSTAMQNAIAGDIVNFRGGTYTAGASDSYRAYWEPSNSGTVGSPITFKAYQGESPVINIVITNDGNYGFGNNGKNFIVFDGFKLQANNGDRMGGILIYQGSNCEVKNCIFDGGTTFIESTDNRETLRIEETTNLLVSNCIFYNVNQINNWHNTSALKMYYSDGIIIENCEIYNVSTGIYIKRDVQNVTVRNSFIHDVNLPIYQSNNGVSSSNISVYNNVIINSDRSPYKSDEDNSYSDNVNIYNNTIANVSSGVGICANNTNSGAEIYNNIFYGIPGTQISTVRDTGVLYTADHNTYYNSLFSIDLHIYGSSASKYTSLASWKSSAALEGGGNPGVGSLEVDPRFVNDSGNLNRLDDFLLATDSLLKGAGRNGEDIGANVALVGPVAMAREVLPTSPSVPVDFSRE